MRLYSAESMTLQDNPNVGKPLMVHSEEIPHWMDLDQFPLSSKAELGSEEGKSGAKLPSAEMEQAPNTVDQGSEVTNRPTTRSQSGVKLPPEESVQTPERADQVKDEASRPTTRSRTRKGTLNPK